MIIKIVTVGIILCLLSLFLKQYFKQLVLPLELLFLCAVVLMLLDTGSDKLSGLSDYFEGLEIGNELFSSLVKSAVVCIITKLSSDICAENGNILVADVIELSGRIMLLVISMPFIEGIINTAIAFIQ